jgi:uncharacterized LabA/DUF88 family protein
VGGKAVVLIDGMYLQNIENAFGLYGKIDYQKFSDKLIGDFQRSRTYVFDALPYSSSAGRSNKQKFLDRLAYFDKFQVEQGYVKMDQRTCPKCMEPIEVPRQKKVDVLIATRLLECSLDQKIDKIVLLAGDADFVPAIEIAKKKTEIVLAFAEVGESIGVSTALKKACDGRIKLDAAYFSDCLRNA